MRHVIYKKDGTRLCDAHGLEYHGEFMGPKYVLCSMSSPTPVPFSPGDYVDYRGERFTLKYDAGSVKQAESLRSGEAFSYPDMRFNSPSTELSDCRFLDYVQSDNEVHYSSLPNFNFFASTVSDLAERIQVNLDRLYTGDRQWRVMVAEDASGNTDINVEVERVTCWDALGYAYTKFGLPFYIKGRTAVIGGLPESLSLVFRYGMGNGLFKIETNVDADQSIVTRLRVYGSTRNMPNRYYNNLVLPYAEIPLTSIMVSNVRLDGVKDLGGGKYECTADLTYISEPGPEKVGDGSTIRIPGGLDLLESIQEDGTAKTRHAEDFLVGGKSGDVFSPSIDEVSRGNYMIEGTRLNFTKENVDSWRIYMRALTDGLWAGAVFKNGTLMEEFPGYLSPDMLYNSIRSTLTGRKYNLPDNIVPTREEFLSNATRTETLGVVELDYTFYDDRQSYYSAISDELPYPSNLQVMFASADSVIGDEFLTGNHNGGLLPDNMSVQNLMLPSFPESTLDPYIDSENIEKYGVIEGDVFFDGSDDDLEEIFPSLEGMTAGELIDAGIDISATSQTSGSIDRDQRVDEIYESRDASGNGVYESGEEIPTFGLFLRDMGFDLSESVKKSGSLSISMKSGSCSGMEFKATDCKKEDIQSGGFGWLVTCERTEVSGSGTYAPNDTYFPEPGDRFVLLGIEMPDVYVKAASQRLLSAGEDYISKVDTPKKTYVPHVDEIEMARQHDHASANGEPSVHDTISEGMRFPMQDDDVLGGEISVTIDTLVIKEGSEDLVPTYEVTLRDEKEEDILSGLQSQISGIPGGSSGSGISGGGSSVPVLKSGDVASSSDSSVYSSLRTDKEISGAIGENNNELEKKFLRKDMQDKTGFLTQFLSGIEAGLFVSGSSGAKLDGDGNAEVGRLLVRGLSEFMKSVTARGDYLTDNFVSGILGSGLALVKRNAAGRSYIEADEIYIRMKAYFDSLEIKHVYHTGGTNVLSPAGMTCSSVAAVTGGTLFDADGDIVLDADGEVVSDASDDGEVTAYRCYFKADDGEKAVVNEFRVGDLATCREFNIKEGVYAGVSNQYYWRKVTAVGDDWIELSNEAGGYAEGSTAPKAGDDIVTLGNDTDKTRQNAIVLGAFGEGSPYFVQYSGIDRFELAEDMVVTRLSPSGNRITGELIIESTGESVETSIGSLGDDIAGVRSETTTKFALQEEKIESKVSETTFNENNEAVSERFSSIEQTVKGITSTVQGVEGEVSEISQSVDGISLKVGTLWPENLFPDGDFRHGTLAKVEAGNIEYVKSADIADYPFSTTAKALYLVTQVGISMVVLGRGQIPAEPGRTYTAMFRCYCNQGDFTTSRCVGISFLNADGGTVYNYNPEDVLLGSWRQVVMKAAAPEGTRGIAVRVGTDGQGGKQLYVTDFMVFEGDLEGNPPENFVEGPEDGLLATGIDIMEKSIRLTSDNVSIRNNSGEETARLDEDGTFTANAIQASFKRVNLDSGVRGIIFKNAFSCVINPTSVGPYVFLPNDAGLSGRVLRIAYGWPGGSGMPIFLLHSVKECKFYMSGRSYATAATENFAIRMIVGCVISMIAVPSGESDDSPVNWHVLTEADASSPGFSINTDVDEELWQEYWDAMTEDKYITI